MLTKIISGGQTGADQAALDVAIKHNIPHGGSIPKGRQTETGPLPGMYHLEEMPTSNYPKRTEKNILDSDGTLIVSHGNITGGTALTKKLAKRHNKPWLHVDMDKMSLLYATRLLGSWIIDNGIQVLNVAGSRASGDPEIYNVTMEILETLFTKRA
ncbi:MAG: putative molybdenum carrier protein [Desulfobulbaceae bacterium]|nr:putative molybdenum carrier protein [Desulfobulbaceae bacterium]